MSYVTDKKPGELTALTSLATDDVFVVGDTSDASEVAKYITKANLITDLGSSFAPVLGADDNYVTDAEKAALHAAVTVTDSTEIDFTLTGQDITASLKAGSIDETKLDTSVNASLDLADSALQAAAIGTTVQAYDADLTTWAGITPGTGVGTALAVNVGSAGAVVTNGGALGTPSSGTVTNLTGTASININGTVGATTPAAGAFTSLTATGTTTLATSLTGVLRGDSGVVSVDTDVTDIVAAASTTAAGKVEIAINTEVNTGTDDTRAVSPDALAGSYAGTKSVSIQVYDGATDVATGDGKAYITIPEALNGMNLIRAQATVVTAGTTNATTVMIHNKTDAADMLSGAISIASAGTVGTVGTVNTSFDDVATNDVLRIDVDSVSTTAPKGLQVILEFRLP